MKKVKKALSFAKLRPKKSKAVLTQTEGDANESAAAAAAARLRASESPASSKEEPPLTSAAPSVSSSTNGSGRQGVRRKKSFYVI
jgi:hypothetical protein